MNKTLVDTSKFTNTWAQGAKIKFVTLPSGLKLRYIQAGEGKALLLLHTIRTQLDYFYKLIPSLSKDYKVYALDLPGHGYSGRLNKKYDEHAFRHAVTEFIRTQELTDVTIVGESIGAVLGLTIAAENPNTIRHVFAINPYDYGKKFGGGIRESKNGWIISFYSIFGSMTPVPKFLLRKVLMGGFVNEEQLDDPFLNELHEAGSLKGKRKVEYRTFKYWRSWNEARANYQSIKLQVVLVYGKQDWSDRDDRAATCDAIPNKRVIELDNVSHFSCLESPEEILQIILTYGI